MQVYLFLGGMKKIVHIFFFLICSVIATAQDFGAAVLVGANFSQVDGDQLGGYNKLGINAGIEINRQIKPEWQGCFEIRYSMKGAKKVIDINNPSPDLKLSYHYLEVPVLVKYTEFNKITPYGGVSLGVNVFNERDDNGFISKEEKLNRGEIGFHLGANYQWTDKWSLDVRHSYSLFSIRDYPIIINSPTVFGRAGWYNRLFTFGLRYNLQ
ncbi:MAG: hypothetical protein RLZZ337_1471 [Bacteroidota bacterium]|jgi:opacity protein-like surface antigen